VYVAHSSDSAYTINSKLSAGLDVVLQPGRYFLDESLKLNKAGQVLLGIGMATLISNKGNACVEVGDASGIRVAGLLLEAGYHQADNLLKWGTRNSGDSNSPGVMSDVFARVGGTNNSSHSQVSAKRMVQVNSAQVLIDHTWLWRADHDVGGYVKYSRNWVDNGLQVNGDDVKAYGLFSEHALGDLVQWNGNYGETYFYQSELPYDVTQDNYANKKFKAYYVDPSVTHHKGYGLGVYSYFRDHTVWMESGIRAPSGRDIHFENSLTVFLSGNGGIKHIVNEEGYQAQRGHSVQYLCNHNFLDGTSTSVSQEDLGLNRIEDEETRFLY